MGENKCLDQETVLLHGGEDEAAGEMLHSACSCRVSRGNRTYSIVTRSRLPLSRRVPSSLVSPVAVVTGTFLFARKFART